MKIIASNFVIFIFFFLPFLALANRAEIERDISRALYLYHTNRYLDSENAFKNLIERIDSSDKEGRLHYLALYYLALSISEQGKSKEAVSLFEKRLKIGREIFGESSFDTAKNYLSLGEAYYRKSELDKAFDYLDLADKTYRGLMEKPNGFLEFVESNRKEYSSGKFNKKKLPEDFSLFYSACENLNNGDKYTEVRDKLEGFSEAGVDFKPSKKFEGLFQANLVNSNVVVPTSDQRVVFVPRNDISVYDEWCIVYFLKNEVVGFELNEG